MYNYPVGFSDHSLGVELPLASVSLGARVIEKHFTIDKKMKGWDQHMSIDSDDLKFLSKGVRRVFTALGVPNIFTVEPQERADAFRRSVVARVSIKNGQTITKEMLDVKRPGTGLPPEKLSSIVGKKAKRDISEDELIQQTDY